MSQELKNVAVLGSTFAFVAMIFWLPVLAVIALFAWSWNLGESIGEWMRAGGRMAGSNRQKPSGSRVA